jgi:hypothetical protein
VANAYATPKIYANAGLKLLKNNLVLAKLVDTESIDKEFTSERGGGKPGGTVHIKRPPELLVRDGRVAQVQDVLEGEVPVSIDKQKGVDVEFTSLEATLSLDDLLKDKVAEAAMAQLATQIDLDLNDELLEFPNWVGTPGQLIDSPADFFKMPERMDELAIPAVGRIGILSPADRYALAGNILTTAAQAGSVARNALEEARIPGLAGIDAYTGQTVPTLVTGTRNATAAINGANQNVAFSTVRNSFQQTLVLDGVGASKTIARGEVFTIANVFAVNPRTKATLPFLAQFVNLVAATSDGSGNVTLTIANPIITSGAYQNVSAAPADDAVVTWMGTASTAYRQNASFHKSALKLVSARLVRPASGECAFATDKDTGITIRYWRTSDGVNDTHLHRWDVIYGTANLDRRLGVRGSGTA